MPWCKHHSIQLPSTVCQWQQWKCTKHGKYRFVNSQSCTAPGFWDPLLLLTLCSTFMVKDESRLPYFSGLLLFLWLEMKLLGLCFFLWEFQQFLANKSFNWDGHHCRWVLAIDGRNQSYQAPSVHQEKTLMTYILPEAKWDLLFLPTFGEFHLISFWLLLLLVLSEFTLFGAV